MLGNITTTRDLNYVDDICEAFYSVFKSNKAIGEILNAGSNSKISIKDLAKKIMKILNVNFKIRIIEKRLRPKASEVINLKCNNFKIKKLTNWKNKTNLILGLTKTINWYKKNYTETDKNQQYQI